VSPDFALPAMDDIALRDFGGAVGAKSGDW